MSSIEVAVGEIRLANDRPFVLVGGMNVLESAETVMAVAGQFAKTTRELSIPWIFKASFDKANRSSIASFRGPGLAEGLRLLAEVKRRFGVPVLTDVHEPGQAEAVAEVADVLQLPAFLSRQTDLVLALARTGAAVNIKKAQFLAPAEMRHILEKFERADNRRLLLCERGTAFGYHNLIVDMLGFQVLKNFAYPVLFDATHALQLPGGQSHGAGGRRGQLAGLAGAGLMQGIAGLFIEAHPDPDQALCDGPCALRLDRLEDFLRRMRAIDALAKSLPAIDTD
ncbi:MAG: 3-deoxy-8-phosphooctulonate synthase [Gammaproteobacteria bacterium]|nr:3-deoxy-8-phosphooctulonate synthase [Gammaproteobacteria bacterium]MCY4269260.1 3-deoxy-8-phosphooctulonate synthase [Gammaproteobacteria bacterium]